MTSMEMALSVTTNSVWAGLSFNIGRQTVILQNYVKMKTVLSQAWALFRKEGGVSDIAKAAKLEQANKIKELVDAGHNYTQIAPMIGISAHQVGSIYNTYFKNK